MTETDRLKQIILDTQDNKEFTCYLCGWDKFGINVIGSIVIENSIPKIKDYATVIGFCCNRCRAVQLIDVDNWFIGSVDWKVWDESKQELVFKDGYGFRFTPKKSTLTKDILSNLSKDDLLKLLKDAKDKEIKE